MPYYKTPTPPIIRGMQWMERTMYVAQYYARRGEFYWSTNKRTKVEKALKKSYRTRKRKYRRKVVAPVV